MGFDATPAPEDADGEKNGGEADEADLASKFFARMRVDAWTVEVVKAFRRHGVHPVLLKVPAIATWLYAGVESTRSYDDADLLVSPVDQASAEKALRDLGFGPRTGMELRPGFDVMAGGWHRKHAVAWIRPGDRANIDLHRTLHGMESVPAERVWAEAVRDGDTCSVGGVTIDIPGAALRTLHVVLHARADQISGSRSHEDLRRAIAHVDRRTWRDASDLALRLGVAEELGGQLRRTSDGARLAEALGLPSAGSLRSYITEGVKRAELPRTSCTLFSLASISGPGAKAAFMVRSQFPPPSFMVKRYALASQGVVGLAACYGIRLFETATQLPGACWNWIRLIQRFRGSQASPCHELDRRDSDGVTSERQPRPPGIRSQGKEDDRGVFDTAEC